MVSIAKKRLPNVLYVKYKPLNHDHFLKVALTILVIQFADSTHTKKIHR